MAVEVMTKTEHRDAMGPFSRGVKRLIDIAGALGGMLVFSPLFIVVYIAIRREDHGPAVFSQERVGYGGRLFTLYKFRSMVIKAEEGGEPKLCAKEDDRLTKVGRFIRDHHVDELPQLWNVIKGDMSLVGTRPPTVDEWEKYEEHHRMRLAIKPGLTGMWHGASWNFILWGLYYGVILIIEKVFFILNLRFS